MSQFPSGLPGIGSALQVIPRTLFIMDTQTGADFLPGGKYIDGVSTRDPDNTIRSDEIRPGLIFGIITNTGTASGAGTATLGALGASIIGTITGAITNATTQTSITLSLAAATELVRRVGSSGTLVLTGPPTTAGVALQTSNAYSAVSVTTGVVTITAPGVAFAAGSWVSANDGSATPFTIFCGEVTNKRVTDTNGVSMATPLQYISISNKPYLIDNIINYPAAAATGMVSYLKTKLRVAVPGATFSDDF